MLGVVAVHQPHLAIVIGHDQFRAPLPTALPPVFRAGRATALQQGKVMDVGHRRALHFNRIILFGFRAEVGQMIGGEVDPADERKRSVHHHDLAMQAAEPIGADAQALGGRVEHLQMHAGTAQGGEIPGRQLSAAKPVKTGRHAYAPLSRLDEHVLQFFAHLVLEHNEGFQEDLGFGLAHGLEHPGEIGFAIFQQFDPIVSLPAVLDVDPLRLAHGRRGYRFFQRGFFHRRATHSSISTDNGA
ncbi:hypothetical protein D3C76_827670 [compost metagenome]